jgi:hypothetical protein
MRAEATRAEPTLTRAELPMMREAEGELPAVREATHESSMASEAAVVSPVVSEAILGLPSVRTICGVPLGPRADAQQRR